MTKAIVKTDFRFDGQKSLYEGKVRDVYNIDDQYLVMVVSDRISAFDVVLPKGIPYKGQVLNQIASKFLDATSDICPNWKIASPDPMVTVGYRCDSFPVEMIVRAYLTGSSWRDYKAGAREICGVPIPDGMREHQRFPHPIVTPTTKAEIGEHDQNISKEEIIAKGLVSKADYEMLEKYALALFDRGSKMAADPGRYEVRIRQEGRRDLPDRRDSYAGQFALFLCRRLRGTFCERRAAASVVEGVCPRMADGPRFPGEARTAGSADDRPVRRERQRPVHRAVREDHRRAIRQGRSGRYHFADRK